MRIAIIGSGISGLGAAWALRHHDVTVYEKDSRIGGHSNTVEARIDGQAVPVDTGFIVFNDRNYPNLVELFKALDVPSAPSDMSFAVSVDGGRLEYSGTNLAGLFAQRRNLLSPGFWGMLLDVLRFFREARGVLAGGALDTLTLGEFLDQRGYGDRFILDHLLPMGAAIWSAPLAEMRAFPMVSFARFFANHGLLSVNDRPQWRTVVGGSREYVRRLVAALPGSNGGGVQIGNGAVAVRRVAGHAEVLDDAGQIRGFDHVIFASHADQSLRLLDDASAEERRILSAFAFQPNTAYLHRDAGLMPRRRRAWSSWNYLAETRPHSGEGLEERAVSLTYWMNKLQPLATDADVFVSLNPLHAPRDETILAEIAYDHPLFNRATLAAQREIDTIQGRNHVWFAGAWLGYGFHEDGLRSGLAVAKALGAQIPWPNTVEPAGGTPASTPAELAEIAAAE